MAGPPGHSAEALCRAESQGGHDFGDAVADLAADAAEGVKTETYALMRVTCSASVPKARVGQPFCKGFWFDPLGLSPRLWMHQASRILTGNGRPPAFCSSPKLTASAEISLGT